MIARLKGRVAEHDGPMAVIDCGGVGYGVFVCTDELMTLKIGEDCTLYIAENIREDGHDLFGFTSASRRQLFRLLISVSGVGPKAAMAILNLGNEGAVRAAIANGDTKYITAASGIGRKVAERVIVDLKNKVGLVAADDATAFLRGSGISEQDEAFQALVGLGYSSSDASSLLADIDPALPIEDRVRMALKAPARK